MFRPSRSRSIGPRVGDSDAGFSLLEILAAFVILALSLTILFRVFGNALRIAETGDTYARALVVAQTQLARVGKVLPLQEGQQEGDEEAPPLHWQIDIAAVPEEKTDQPVALPTARLLRVKVRVSLPGGSADRAVELSTYRVAPLKPV